MPDSKEQEEMMYEVLVNHEEQYAIWAQDLPLPPGWTRAGKQGAKQACLDFIDAVWCDMRPLSLRREMDA